MDNKLFVIDFKTSNAIHPEYFLQTAAYTYARYEETNLQYDDPWVIKIGKDGSLDVQQMKDWKRNFEVFLACLALYKWRNEEFKNHYLNHKNHYNENNGQSQNGQLKDK